MKILLTGANGFLGDQIFNYGSRKNSIDTLSRDQNATFCKDISKSFKLSDTYDLVIHAAGKAHLIPKSTEDYDSFFKVNLNGTKNLLEALNRCPPKRFVFVSTVAVYGVEKGQGISEEESLKGISAYAKSKIDAEAEVVSWCKKNDVEFLILRLPLISGPNPPGNLGALYKAIQKGYYFRIGKGSAIRSMVAGQDVAEVVFNCDWKTGIYNLTDGVHPSIADTENYIAKLLEKKIKSLPDLMVLVAAKIGDLIPKFPLTTSKYKKLKYTLTFSDAKARNELGWNPKPALTRLSFSKDS